jgi:catechol 2,3-dioxygenase-like lactoylglutathione lyase family enzyme
MRRVLSTLAAAAILLWPSACSVTPRGSAAEVEVPADKPAPITTRPWSEVSVSVTDLDAAARFFREIGSYETVHRGPLPTGSGRVWGLPEPLHGEALLLRAPGAAHGFVRLIRFDTAKPRRPTRPGARAWDTGCYWSIMVRAKDLQSIIDDAIAMGWWTETPMAYLEFGPSKLNVVVLKGPGGMQVQAYERLTTPLPEGFPEFERISQPFNLMQMTRDRAAVRRLIVDVMGFDTFWFGSPYTDPEPTIMPLGIPQNLTTSVPYKAGIFYPVPGEFGRLEAIEIDGLEGEDHADRCVAPNLGILRVSYRVDDLSAARQRFRGTPYRIISEVAETVRQPFGRIRAFTIAAPDGGQIEFFELSIAD